MGPSFLSYWMAIEQGLPARLVASEPAFGGAGLPEANKMRQGNYGANIETPHFLSQENPMLNFC
jgi:hypothetical protein